MPLKPSKTSSSSSSPKPSKPSMYNGESSRKRKPKDLNDDEDAITILNAVVEFRSNHGGAIPTPSTMKPVFDAIKGSLHRDLTIEQLYNKFRSLKSKYYKSIPTGAGPTPFDRAFFDLSAKAWGEKKPPNDIKKPKGKSKKKKIEETDIKGKKDEENDDDDDDDDDAGDSFKCMTDQVTEHWGEEGMSMETLKLGLKLMDKSKAKVLEKEWMKYFKADLKIQAKSCSVNGEILTSMDGL